MRIWHFPALAGVYLVASACSGTSSIGGEEGGMGAAAGDDSGGTGGRGGSSMRGGSSGTSGSAGRGGVPSMGGGSVGGSGGAPSPCAGRPCGAQCSYGSPMSEPDAPSMVAVGYCDAAGECGLAFPSCDNECETSDDCGVPEIACQMCPDGATQCPTATCEMGRCITTYPSCAIPCMSDAGCPTIAGPCQICPDGTTSCPKAECLMGRCTTTWPTCGEDYGCDGRQCGERCNPTCTAMGCGMSANVAFTCNADGRCTAEPAHCGAECESAMDCPLTDICHMCNGGTCGTMDCVSGHCEFVCPAVPPPDPECTSASDCIGDAICRYCPDMSCAEIACINGECKSVCPL